MDWIGFILWLLACIISVGWMFIQNGIAITAILCTLIVCGVIIFKIVQIIIDRKEESCYIKREENRHNTRR